MGKAVNSAGKNKGQQGASDSPQRFREQKIDQLLYFLGCPILDNGLLSVSKNRPSRPCEPNISQPL
jgi:hypothetical protein